MPMATLRSNYLAVMCIKNWCLFNEPVENTLNGKQTLPRIPPLARSPHLFSLWGFQCAVLRRAEIHATSYLHVLQCVPVLEARRSLFRHRNYDSRPRSRSSRPERARWGWTHGAYNSDGQLQTASNPATASTVLRSWRCLELAPLRWLTYSSPELSSSHCPWTK